MSKPTSAEITDHVRATADRYALEDRALEVAKVAAPIFASLYMSQQAASLPGDTDRKKQAMRELAVTQARALIAEARRQLQEPGEQEPDPDMTQEWRR